MHKLYQDAIAERAIIYMAKRAPFGGTVVASEVKEMMRDRWVRKTVAGTAIGMLARGVGYGLTGYAIYDTAKFAKFAGDIFEQHLENAIQGEVSAKDAQTFTKVARMRG